MHRFISRICAVTAVGVLVSTTGVTEASAGALRAASFTVTGQLNSIAAVSSSNAWAVGYTSNCSHSSFETLILRWNGTAWK